MTIVVIYLCGVLVWIVGFAAWLGYQDEDLADYPEILLGCLWPITLPAVIAYVFGLLLRARRRHPR